MTSNTLQTLAVAVIVILIAVMAIHELPSLLGGLLEHAAKAGAQVLKA
jgi:hypothetical protein